MENLDDEMNSMFNELGLDDLEMVPKINTSKRKDYQSYFDHETTKMANHIYNADFKIFNYE